MKENEEIWCMTTEMTPNTSLNVAPYDQGGSVMNVSYDITYTLRANDGGHPPLILCSYGFKPQQGAKAHGMGFEKEKAPSLTAAANQGVLVEYESTSDP